MTKKIVRLTEYDIHRIVKECVVEILKKYNPEDSLLDSESRWAYESQLIEKYASPGIYRHMKWSKAQKALYEGLIRSFNTDTMARKLQDIGIKVISVRDEPTPEIFIDTPPDENALAQLLTQSGWYTSIPEPGLWCIVPRFGHSVDSFVYDECGGTLYHATPATLCDKIMKQGLKPRSGHKIDNSQELVHFFATEDECIALASSLSNTDPNHPKVYTLLKINLKKEREYNIRPKFYQDPKHLDAVVTLEPIAPWLIEKLYDFEIE